MKLNAKIATATALLLLTLMTSSAVTAAGVGVGGPGAGSTSGTRVWNSATPPESYSDYYNRFFGCEFRSGYSNYNDQSANVDGSEYFNYSYVNFCLLGASACEVLNSSVAETSGPQPAMTFQNTDTLMVDNGRLTTYHANMFAFREGIFQGTITIQCTS